MPLNLKEAEVAAYADPSQENLAVYVKLLEEALDESRGISIVASILEERGFSTEDPEELEAELDRLEGAPSREEHINLQNKVTELEDKLRGVGK